MSYSINIHFCIFETLRNVKLVKCCNKTSEGTRIAAAKKTTRYRSFDRLLGIRCVTRNTKTLPRLNYCRNNNYSALT